MVVYKHVDQLKIQKYTFTFSVYLLFLTKLSRQFSGQKDVLFSCAQTAGYLHAKV